MTLRTSAIAIALIGAAACSPKRIPGTQIEDTADTRAVNEIVQAYRKAMESRDAPAVLALVAPTYFDNAGTPDPSDDLDRAGLEAALVQDLARADAIRLELTVRKIEVSGDDAQVELFYDSYYKVKTPGREVPRRDSDIERMKLKKIGGAWRFVSGL
jgi:ketosteroid isomerase-like protein